MHCAIHSFLLSSTHALCSKVTADFFLAFLKSSRELQALRHINGVHAKESNYFSTSAYQLVSKISIATLKSRAYPFILKI